MFTAPAMTPLTDHLRSLRVNPLIACPPGRAGQSVPRVLELEPVE
jgi:hypothetical protein